MKRKWTINTIQDFLNYDKKWILKNGSGYRILEEKKLFNGIATLNYFLIKCPNPQHEEIWKDTSSIVYALAGCKKCWYEKMGKNQRNNLEKVFKELTKYGVYPVDLERDYIKNNSRLECLVEREGVEYTIYTSLKALRKSKKVKISIFHVKNPYTIRNINQWCKKYRPSYRCISKEYKNATSPLQFEYLGTDLPYGVSSVFEMSWHEFQKGIEHPALNKSRGHHVIRRYLLNKKFTFSEEVPLKNIGFSVPKSIANCRFDFVIYNNKGDILLVIEYDGEQHYKRRSLFHKTDDEFNNYIDRDRKKRAFLKERNIPLIIVRFDVGGKLYDEYEIKKYLDGKLNKFFK
ncbi:DUF2726 domain-containing protein [Parageobacillus thermoglucosidasius]|uniref:DUF2726 domain-containing protein n=1 Tax=Parageobacillus thermoglucosidasius TaxID=1426 RepID=A0A1B7KX50_PARTM|nr:DUF2726 domain-containing protein [Parageobacillus thermoglucosidasius]OAT74636.1 hypothetical protein A7K69_02680 [Parageobacillus thermoglucosidasius]